MSSFSRAAWLRGDEDESEDDDIVDEQVRDRPDAIVYLVEVSESMLACTPDPEDPERQRSNVSTALRSALELMKTRIISGSPRDVVGVVLYNTTQSHNVKGELPKEGIYMLIEPSTIRAVNIKALADLVEEIETSPRSFRHKYTPVDTQIKQTQLIEAMRFSESLLKNRSSNLSNRSLYLITDHDDPFHGNKQQQKVALVFANDAHEAGFSIKTFFMPSDGSNFDLGKFWNRFRYDPSVDAEMDNASMVFSGEQRFEKLLSLSSESGKTKRAMFTIPFFLYEGIAMSITGYGAINEQKKKAPVNIEQTDEIREVYSKVQYTDEGTGEELDAKKDVVKFMRIGDKGPDEQRIFFEPEEIAKMKNLGMSPSLKLLGFMPRDQMKPQHTIKHSYLIYPNETEYANSIPAFSALLKSMLKKDVVGLGVLIARVNSSPQFVYLLPQEETRDPDTDVQMDPPCIWLIQIPFADDIRPPTINTCLSVADPEDEGDSAVVKSFRTLIKKMRVLYRPYQFTNPTLQYHYANLEAIALQLDPPEPKDDTLPLTDQIAKRIAPYAKEIKAEIEEHPKLHAVRGSGAAGYGSDEGGPTKKPRVSTQKASQSIDRLQDTLLKACKSDNFKQVTNNAMKDYLKQKNVKNISTLKKADLITAVREQLENDGLL